MDTEATIPLAPRERLTPTEHVGLCFALGASATMCPPTCTMNADESGSHHWGDHSPLVGRPAGVGSAPSPMAGISGHGAGAMGHSRGVTPRTNHDRAYDG